MPDPAAADREARIRAYFGSCNHGSPEEIAAHFTDGAVIWDTNHAPVRTADGIGRFWQRIREQWRGARWSVDRVVTDGDTAAIEWAMTGTGPDGPFRFHGSEHYAFEGDRIAEIRQYWIFDRDRLDTGLVDYPYGPPEEG
jgi:ketosteroid isomerase-like protein